MHYGNEEKRAISVRKHEPTNHHSTTRVPIPSRKKNPPFVWSFGSFGKIKI